MREGNRATRSAALVAGFGLIAWAQVVAALAVVLLVLALLPAAVALRVGAPLCIATAGLLWFATSRALRVRPGAPAGVPVTRSDAPTLWALVDAAATTAQAAPPDGVTVIADARVWVGERSRFLGLLGGPRQLYVGLPLLQAWDVSRLGAAVTHELAHGSTVLGRFAPVAYRGRLVLARVVRRIPRRSPAGPLLRAYAGFYRRLDASFAWAQELAADRAAAAFAGPEAAAAVLRDGPALETMQQLFHAEYLGAGWQAGFVPDDVFGGLLHVLAARPDEMSRLRSLPAEPPADGDPHPPLADRMTALAALSAPASSAPVPGVAAGAAAPAAASGAAVAGAASGAAVAGAASGVPAAGGLAGGGADLAASARGSSDSGFAGPPAPASGVSASGGLAAGTSAAAAAGTGVPVPDISGFSDPGVSGGSASGSSAAGAASSGAAVAEPGRAGPAITAVVAPGEAAADLIPDLPGLGRALQAVAFPTTGRTMVDWDEFFTVTRNAEMEREADAALRAIGHAVSAPVTGLAEVLDLVADGRLPKAADVVFAGLPPAETHERITDLITLLLALAALRSGAARWRHSWSGTAELVAIDGGHLDLAEPASLAADPATVDLARTRLAELGIDLSLTARPDPARPPARVPVHGGVVNVLADGVRTDLLILETGLLLIPSLPRSRNGDSRRRLARLAAAGINPDGSLAASPRASDFPAEAASPPTRPTSAAFGAATSQAVPGWQAVPGSQAVPGADDSRAASGAAGSYGLPGATDSQTIGGAAGSYAVGGVAGSPAAAGAAGPADSYAVGGVAGSPAAAGAAGSAAAAGAAGSYAVQGLAGAAGSHVMGGAAGSEAIGGAAGSAAAAGAADSSATGGVHGSIAMPGAGSTAGMAGAVGSQAAAEAIDSPAVGRAAGSWVPGGAAGSQTLRGTAGAPAAGGVAESQGFGGAGGSQPASAAADSRAIADWRAVADSQPASGANAGAAAQEASRQVGAGAADSRSGDPAGALEGRLVPYADVVRAAVMQGRRRQWELTLASGAVLTLRTTLDSDELQGGWAALEEAVAFLTRTRTPPPTREQPATDPAPDGHTPHGEDPPPPDQPTPPQPAASQVSGVPSPSSATSP